jgi:single-strand DNA-binding protein
MTDTITLTGLVATPPRHITTTEGLEILSFRLASTQRRYDRRDQKWVDGDTNWYTVSAFRQLAKNAAGSISRGERVVVTGRLKVREYATADKTGVSIDVEADSLGHDLLWGTSVFTRTVVASSQAEPKDDETAADAAEPVGDDALVPGAADPTPF